MLGLCYVPSSQFPDEIAHSVVLLSVDGPIFLRLLHIISIYSEQF